MSLDQFAALYERGFAIGQSNIVDETMTFCFRDETLTFPTFRVYPLLENSHLGFYTVPVDKLRELGGNNAA
jgi:hypothetical protein